MRGGARPNAGRKKGGINRAKAEAALMRKAEYRTGRKLLAKDVLVTLLDDFHALARAAKDNNDPAGFVRWSKAAVECAALLAPYQSPKLNAITTVPVQEEGPVVFKLNIFDRERKPENLPSLPPPESATPSSEAKTIDVEPAKDKPPAEERSPGAEEGKKDKPAPGARSLWEHPVFALRGTFIRGCMH
jgi:hypothetical protein